MKREYTIYGNCLSIFLLILMCWSSGAESTQTEIWTTGTFEEFQQGETTQITLTKTGEITLAPELQDVLSLEGNDLLVWTLVQDSKGNLYAGTGDQGKIFKIDPHGEASLFFDSPEISILSLAVDAGDNVYAGSTPDGLVYKITPDGSQTVLCMTGEHYIWGLVFGPDNTLYAATGESGKIFKILPNGTSTVLYDSPQTHIMSLVYDPRGWLYAGTEGKGVTYKVDLEGKAFVLYQAPEDEIHALALDSQGLLYVAAISNKVFPKSTAPAPKEPQPAPQEKGLKKSVIYQISDQGTISTLLKLEDILIYSMLVDQQDNVLLGTDHEGMLFQVFPNSDYHQILDVDANSILALYKNPEGVLYLGTGDTGSIYRVLPQPAAQGEYLSIVHDAETTATWGKIFWQGTPQQIKVFTRTGNTSKPDDTWSAWSHELLNQDGENIPNFPARFIQWKAVLTPDERKNPLLEDLSVAYLPNNRAPEIQQIRIFQGGNQPQSESTSPVRRSSGGAPAPPRSQAGNGANQNNEMKAPQFIPPGYVAIAWEAQDPNNEPLQYTVSLKGEGEPVWKILKEELESGEYVLDSKALPDGQYYIKITATDSSHNPPTHALQAEKVSERFEVDNTVPQISIALNQQQEHDAVQVTVIAHDDFSHLKNAEYAVDAADWISIFPDDQVSDSRDEKYSIDLSELDTGDHVLVFKATDSFGNVGAGKILFTVPDTTQPQDEQTPEALPTNQ